MKNLLNGGGGCVEDSFLIVFEIVIRSFEN